MARLKDAPITRLNKQRGLDKEVVMGVHVRFLGYLNEILCIKHKNCCLFVNIDDFSNDFTCIYEFYKNRFNVGEQYTLYLFTNEIFCHIENSPKRKFKLYDVNMYTLDKHTKGTTNKYRSHIEF